MAYEKYRLSEEELDRRMDSDIIDVLEPEGDEAAEAIPSALIKVSDLLARFNVQPEEIYRWYSSAMVRRDRAAIDEESFISHFWENGYEEMFAFGNSTDGFVLGAYNGGLFIPTHFAPKTMRGGYRLIKDLGESKTIPSLMAITEDLSDTVKKLPCWKNLGINLPSTFRGQAVDKKVVYNSHNDTERLMQEYYVSRIQNQERGE